MLSAPIVERYIRILERRGMGVRWADTGALDEIFRLLRQIEPVRGRDFWELWLRAPRGPIEDFGDLEEMLANEEVESEEEFRSWWLEEFPEPVVWFRFGAVQDKNYRAIILNNRIIMEERLENAGDFTFEAAEFAEWILEALREVLTQLKAGTYNSDVEAHLPIQYRTGTIVRRDLWEADPESREPFELPEEDLARFLKYAVEQPETWSALGGRLPSMTANDFYRFCAMGYKANGYPGTGLPPRKQYEEHADGRDEGLGAIDPDDPDSFCHWLEFREDHYGHPWEVCRGGNSTHISLQVWRDKDGYLLWLAGSSWSRTIETVRFYLVLMDAGLPVFLYDADMLASRLTGDELVGIVPEDVTPAYCGSLFPEQDVIDFQHFPLEYAEQLANKVTWQPVSKVRLSELNES